MPHLRAGFQRNQPRSGGLGVSVRVLVLGVTGSMGRLARRGARRRRPAGQRRRRSGSACRAGWAELSRSTLDTARGGPRAALGERERKRAPETTPAAGPAHRPKPRPPAPTPTLPTNPGPSSLAQVAPTEATHQPLDPVHRSLKSHPPPKPWPTGSGEDTCSPPADLPGPPSLAEVRSQLAPKPTHLMGHAQTDPSPSALGGLSSGPWR